MYRAWSLRSICSCTYTNQLWINGDINDQKSPQSFKRKLKFQLAFAAFAFFSVFALPGRLPGQLASHRWSDVGTGKNACSFINGMTLQLHILLPKICDLSENLKCAMYAMCKSVKVGFPQPVEDRLTFSFSSFFTSQADAILNAHAGNVLRKMKCPLHYTKNIRNFLQLTATPISPMPAMKPRSHQKWNTLNSQHGGLDHGLSIFFCLVSSVAGPLWVHVVDKMPKKHPWKKYRIWWVYWRYTEYTVYRLKTRHVASFNWHLPSSLSFCEGSDLDSLQVIDGVMLGWRKMLEVSSMEWRCNCTFCFRKFAISPKI